MSDTVIEFRLEGDDPGGESTPNQPLLPPTPPPLPVPTAPVPVKDDGLDAVLGKALADNLREINDLLGKRPGMEPPVPPPHGEPPLPEEDIETELPLGPTPPPVPSTLDIEPGSPLALKNKREEEQRLIQEAQQEQHRREMAAQAELANAQGEERQRQEAEAMHELEMAIALASLQRERDQQKAAALVEQTRREDEARREASIQEIAAQTAREKGENELLRIKAENRAQEVLDAQRQKDLEREEKEFQQEMKAAIKAAKEEQRQIDREEKRLDREFDKSWKAEIKRQDEEEKQHWRNERRRLNEEEKESKRLQKIVDEDPYNAIQARMAKRGKGNREELDAFDDLKRGGVELDDEEDARWRDLHKKLNPSATDKIAKTTTQALGQAGVPGAGAAGGIAEMAAGAATGPGAIVAAVMAIGEMVQKKIDEMVKAVVDTVKEAGQVMSHVAALSPGAVVEDVNRGVEAGGQFAKDNIPILGQAIDFTAQLTAQFNRSLMGLTESIDQTARKLGPYSGPLATQLGLAEARATLGDIGRAQKLGPELSGFVEAKSRLEQSAMDALAEVLLKSNLIGLLTNLMAKAEPYFEQAPKMLGTIINLDIDACNIARAILNAHLRVATLGTKQVEYLHHIDMSLDKSQTREAETFLDELMKTF
jgi:hypothetical protein